MACSLAIGVPLSLIEAKLCSNMTEIFVKAMSHMWNSYSFYSQSCSLEATIRKREIVCLRSRILDKDHYEMNGIQIASFYV